MYIVIGHAACTAVQPVVGREPPIMMDKEVKQVTDASSNAELNALHEIYGGLSALPKMTISDVTMYMGRDNLYPCWS